jgi:nucleoside-diphosphate-sugar epimerase
MPDSGVRIYTLYVCLSTALVWWRERYPQHTTHMYGTLATVDANSTIGGEVSVDWQNTRVVVTGGTSFIGSHLVDALIARGVRTVRVVDDLSSGKLENIDGHLQTRRVEFMPGDLLQPHVAQIAVRDMDVVFHLAAIHGGRGYVDLHQAGCAQNLALDGMLIKAAYESGVQKFVFASSGCVYPNFLETNVEEELFLTEDMVGPPYDADNTYGWAKLMAEMTLKAYYHDFGFRSASCRFFTVYGERGVENHAVMAMIARAFLRQNPFDVWGNGQQIRNWTHVDDIVRGMLLAAENIDDATAVNLGTQERIRVIDAVHEVLRYTGHKAEINFQLNMPVGPVNRVASNQLAKDLLGWSPEISFMNGLHRTIDWYFATKSRDDVLRIFDHMLTER